MLCLFVGDLPCSFHLLLVQFQDCIWLWLLHESQSEMIQLRASVIPGTICCIILSFSRFYLQISWIIMSSYLHFRLPLNLAVVSRKRSLLLCWFATTLGYLLLLLCPPIGLFDLMALLWTSSIFLLLHENTHSTRPMLVFILLLMSLQRVPLTTFSQRCYHRLVTLPP